MTDRLRSIAPFSFLLLLSLTGIANAAEPLAVSLFAGTGSAGHRDGLRNIAQFNASLNIAVNRDGVVYVADSANYVIRRIGTDGVVSTLAGQVGVTGARDGTGSQALFGAPNSLAVDSQGNVFVTDNANSSIRKVTPEGVVTTLAGSLGNSGRADGTGSAARFDHPHGIAVDASDNLYVADVANHSIRKITPAGVVTTLAGTLGARGDFDGTGSSARFNFPSGIAVDSAGNVWVSGNAVLRRVSPQGVVRTIAGAPGNDTHVDGPAATARFNGPEGLAVAADGNLYICELGARVIRVLDTELNVSTVAGAVGESGLVDGSGTQVRFGAPIGIAAGPGGRLYIGDAGNHSIRMAVVASAVSSVRVDSVAADATLSNGWPIRVSPTNFTFDCSSSPADRAGKWELLVDGAVRATSCRNVEILPALTPGRHEIGVRVVGADGLPASATQTTAVTIAPDPAFTYAMLLPAQARAAGAGGSFFRSSSWLVNPSATVSAIVRVRLVPGAGFADLATVNPMVLTVPPRQMLAFDDILAEVFRVSGDTGGSVVIETSAGSAPLVTARTFNDTASGTFGQYIRANDVPAQSSGELWLEGLATDTANRSNLGIINYEDTARDATVTLHGPDGRQVGSTVVRSVPARSFLQLGRVNDVAGAGELALFSARVTGAFRFGAYASRLDNTTSDPIFITPLTAAREQWIDGVGSVPGAGGTFFRSMLVVANRNAAPAVVQLRYAERGATTTSASATLTVPANGSVSTNDVVSQLLARPNTAGWLTLASDVPVTAWARTFNDRGAAGTFGQFIPAFTEASLFGVAGAVLPGVTEDAAYRSNFGAVNVSTAPANIAVVATRDDGTTAAEKSYRLEAGQSLFVSRILTDLGVTAGGRMYLEVKPSVARAVYAWVSYVDNRSTDQTFVRPIVLE